MEKEVVIKVPPSCELSLKQREQREHYIAEKAMIANDIKAEKEKMWAWIAEVLKEQETIKTALDKVNSTF
jgi:hypothetical protein